MSQNMSSRRQELLSRLKTTLAIVSQATGFDNERSAGDSRPAEQPQWNSLKDPRLRRQQETYNEGLAASEPGSSTGSAAVPASSASSSAAPSSSVFHKFDEIQDEDEFLYGSSVSVSSARQPVPDSKQDKRADEPQIGNLHWSTQSQVHEEQRWARAPVAQQPSYADPPQAVSQQAGDSRWMGNTESTRIGPISDQSQWMQPTAQRGGDHSWGGNNQTLRYSEVDDRQSMGRGPQMASGSVGMISESAVSKLQGINAGMLEGILKLVASGTTTSASQSLPLQQQQQPQLQQQQQQLQQQQQHLQQLQQQQPSFESRRTYGSGYPPQTVYSQPPDSRSYFPPGIPHDVPSGAVMFGQPSQLPHSVYDYGLVAPRQHPATENPHLGQISTAFVDSNLAQTPSRPVTDHMPRLTGMMESTSSRSQPFFSRPVATSLDSQFAVNQPAVVQPYVAASTPSQSFVPEKPLFAMQNQYPVGYGVSAPAVAPQPEKTAVVEPDKGGSGLQKSDVDKDTLSRLLNMIGCSSNVTSLMQELIKKDEQEKVKKQETPAEQTTAQPDHGPALPPPSAVEAQPRTTGNDTVKPNTTAASVLQATPEPAGVPDSTAHDDESKPALQPEPSKPVLQSEPAKESEAEETKATIPVLSSLSRLQNYDNPDSPDENGEKDSAAETGDKKSLFPKDDEWERSTEEFLRSLQSKATTPLQSQKEKSRSTSRDKSVRDKPKMKTAGSKKSPSKQLKSEAKKVKDKREVENKVSAAETDGERENLMRGKHEIEGALELLQKELANLRTNKKRLLESSSSAERDEELENSIANERKLTDHMSQLKTAMAELNKHLEKLSSTKPKVCLLVDEV